MNGMPAWMDFLVKINPLTYSVDMFKKIILQPENLAPALREAMGLNLSVFGHVISFSEEMIVVLVLSILFVVLATVRFNRSEA